MKNTIGIVDGVATVLPNDPWSVILTQGPDDRAYQVIPFKSLPLHVNEIQSVTKLGILLQPDDDPMLLEPWMEKISLIALQFPSFRDGRAYSQASLLRSRYGFTGDLRAVGDVLRDQLSAMRHCGFSSFVVREDKSVVDALKGLTGFDLIYARSVTNPEPLFRYRQRA